MFRSHLGNFQTGMGVRTSQDEVPQLIMHAGKIMQESAGSSEPAGGGKAHAGERRTALRCLPLSASAWTRARGSLQPCRAGQGLLATTTPGTCPPALPIQQAASACRQARPPP
jgi:hypothetical protein